MASSDARRNGFYQFYPRLESTQCLGLYAHFGNCTVSRLAVGGVLYKCQTSENYWSMHLV